MTPVIDLARSDILAGTIESRPERVREEKMTGTAREKESNRAHELLATSESNGTLEHHSYTKRPPRTPRALKSSWGK